MSSYTQVDHDWVELGALKSTPGSATIPGVSHVRSGSSGRWFPVEESEGLSRSLCQEGAFLPRPLSSKVRLSPSTYRLLTEAHSALGRLDEAANRLPDRAALVRCTQLQELQASAGLSGTFAMAREVFLVDLPGPTAPTVDERLSRFVHGSSAATEVVGEGGSMEIALNTASAMFSGAPASVLQWRKEMSWLGGPNPRKAYLIVAPPGRRTRTEARRLFEWMAAPHELPAAGKAILGHFQLATVAPFYHAEYLARLYIPLQLIRDGELRDQILPISTWLARHRREYQAHLRGLVDDGNVDAWIAFLAGGIRDTCHQQVRLITEIERVSVEQMSRFVSSDLFPRVVFGLAGHPVTNGYQIAQLYGVSVDHAAHLTNKLHDEKLVKVLDNKSKLERVDGKSYATVVFCPAILRLFSRYQPMPPAIDRNALK